MLTEKKWRLTENFFSAKTIRFVWNNSYVGACVSVFTAWWPNAKIYFSVNCKISLRIDRKNLQFTVDRTHYWLKVPNILRTYLSIQNVHFPLLWDFFQELAGKSSPLCPRFWDFSDFRSPRFTMCHMVLLKMWFFHSVNPIFAVRIFQIFVHIYAYKMYLYFVHF